jgi:hypothetical protein
VTCHISGIPDPIFGTKVAASPSDSSEAIQKKCAILDAMTGEQQIWQSWARTIHKWGLANLVAAVLESAGPISLLGAQIVYISQPLLQPVAGPGRLQALAGLLEDPQQTRAFLDILQGEQSR